jgi:hypothetical protein
MREKLDAQHISAKYDSMVALIAKYREFTGMGQKATFPLHSTDTR